jgi:FG-GAP-like repeat
VERNIDTRRTILLCATLAAAMVVACSAVLGSAAAAVCGSSWTTVTSAPEITVPQAIAAIAPDDIWVTGRKERGTQGITTGAEHWDGTSWTLVPTPNGATGKGAENALSGADGLSKNNVWAVGYSKAGGPYKTLVGRWNGTQWSVVPSPNVGTSHNVLADVDAIQSDLAWAVGYFREGSSRQTLLLRWNGTQWKTIPSPNPGAMSNTLLDVAAIAPNDVWAIGHKSSGAGYQSLILHYNGTNWEQVSAPSVGRGDNVLTSISAVSATDLWAAGYFVDGTQHKTLTLRYDGTAWRQVPSANAAGGITTLQDIDASSPTSAWAVGFEYLADGDRYVASTQHWNGTSWSAFPSSARTGAGQNSQLLAVANAPGTSQVWAAGAESVVETICLSGSMTAASSTQGSLGGDDIASDDVSSGSIQAIEQPSYTPSASVSAMAEAIPVRAVNRASNAGIAELTDTHGAVIDDLNNDTLPDIFLGRHGLPARFYVNEGNGHFTETNQGTFRRKDRHGCAAADVNQDELEDLFCTTGAATGTRAKRNELYIQRQDHTFVNRAAQYGVLDPFGRGREGTFVRADGDNFPDLLVVNELERADGMPSPNRLFIDQSGSAYRYAPEYGLEREVGDGADTGGVAAAADIDRDGWQDLLVQTNFGLRLYRNDQGSGFTDATNSVGLGQNVVDATLANVNGDAWPDIIQVTSSKLSVLHNTDGRFSLAFSAPLSAGLAVAAGDVNGDGRADAYVMRTKTATSNNAPDQVYLNNGTGNNFSLMSSIPSTSQGAAESVWPIDHDGNGLTDFLVLNGKGQPGPVQLIAFFPAS